MKGLTIDKLWYWFLLVGIFSYLVGCINFAIIISKIKNKGKGDIRTMGSGNPGMLNMSRNYGMKIGVLILFLDILKGLVPSLIAGLIFRKYYYSNSGICLKMPIQAVSGLCSVCGHIFPFWLKFKGGKGISTTIGFFISVEPVLTLCFGVTAIVFILLTNMGSMGSFIATTPSAIVAVWKFYEKYHAFANTFSEHFLFNITNIFLLAIILITWWAHRKNIQRLLKGEEHPTNWMQMIKNIKYKSRLKKEKIEK